MSWTINEIEIKGRRGHSQRVSWAAWTELRLLPRCLGKLHESERNKDQELRQLSSQQPFFLLSTPANPHGRTGPFGCGRPVERNPRQLQKQQLLSPQPPWIDAMYESFTGPTVTTYWSRSIDRKTSLIDGWKPLLGGSQHRLALTAMSRCKSHSFLSVSFLYSECESL